MTLHEGQLPFQPFGQANIEDVHARHHCVLAMPQASIQRPGRADIGAQLWRTYRQNRYKAADDFCKVGAYRATFDRHNLGGLAALRPQALQALRKIGRLFVAVYRRENGAGREL